MSETTEERRSRHFKLSESGIALLDRLAVRGGVSRTAVLETLIRAEARREGVDTPQKETREP